MKKKKLISKKPATMLIATCCTAWPTVSMATDFDTLTNRLVATTVSSEIKKAYQEEYADLTAKAAELLQTQTAAGCWADINYADTESNDGWDPLTHLQRLIAMAAEYETNASTSVRDGVLKALDCWYKDNSTASSPTAVNWWWNDIGKQKYLGPTGLIMTNDLSAEQLANLIADMPSAPSMTGANRSDISKGVIYGGLLSQDAGIVSSGISGILDTVVTTESEGMQVDMSWLQHGPQLHNGSYGQAWVGTALPWAYYVRDLQWKFPADKAELIANFILEGDQWMTRPNGGMDYSTAGRSVSRAPKVVAPAPADPNYVPNSEKIAAIAPSRAAEALSYQNFLDTGVASKTGFKHFWRADYSVSRRPNYTFSIHMASTDVALQEHGNGENQLGYWMGFGNTFLYKNGAEYQDIFPVWRWDVMSGVTAPQVSLVRAKTWGNNFQNSTFVGAATDGNYGVTVMDFVHTDPTTSTDDTFAKKAWFSFEDEIVALGAGISSTRAENIVTTVNETLLNGAVTVDGTEYAKGSTPLANAKWVHHDDVAYVFPTAWYGQLENETQTGNWADLNPGNASEVVTKDTFFLNIGHGTTPTDASYQYIIVPGVNTSEAQAYSDALPVSVLANSTTTQAVRHSGLNMTGIIFHAAGSLEVYTGFTVTVDKPSVLLINESGNYPVVSISTPGTSNTVSVTLDSAVLGKLVQSITTPSSVAEMGKTVTVTFDGSTAVDLLTPTDDNRVRGGTYADTNYGESTSLVVKKSSNVSYDRKSYLKWDLSSVTAGTIATAKIKLHVSTLASGATAQFDVSDTVDNWDEATLTWNNAPSTGTLIASKTATTLGEWITIDVTDYVKAELAGDKTVSIVLTPATADETYLGLSSVEAAIENRPQMEFTYVNPPTTLNPTDDNRVRGGTYADTNYGEASSLVVKKSSNASYDRKSYLKWDLSSVTDSTISKAEIKLHVATLTSGATAQFDVSDTVDNWDEATLTWNNAPATGTLISTQTASTLGEWLTIDVTNYVNAELAGDKTLSIVLTPATANETYLGLSSVEAAQADRPQLVITP